MTMPHTTYAPKDKAATKLFLLPFLFLKPHAKTTSQSNSCVQVLRLLQRESVVLPSGPGHAECSEKGVNSDTKSPRPVLIYTHVMFGRPMVAVSLQKQVAHSTLQQ